MWILGHWIGLSIGLISIITIGIIFIIITIIFTIKSKRKNKIILGSKKVNKIATNKKIIFDSKKNNTAINEDNLEVKKVPDWVDNPRLLNKSGNVKEIKRSDKIK